MSAMLPTMREPPKLDCEIETSSVSRSGGSAGGREPPKLDCEIETGAYLMPWAVLGRA